MRLFAFLRLLAVRRTSDAPFPVRQNPSNLLPCLQVVNRGCKTRRCMLGWPLARSLHYSHSHCELDFPPRHLQWLLRRYLPLDRRLSLSRRARPRTDPAIPPLAALRPGFTCLPGLIVLQLLLAPLGALVRDRRRGLEADAVQSRAVVVGVVGRANQVAGDFVVLPRERGEWGRRGWLSGTGFGGRSGS